VLLEGPAGSGKSTLLEVLSGGRATDQGGIQHDGLDLRRADLGSVRDLVVGVGPPQFVVGSVRDNLFLGSPPLPERSVRRLLHLVQMEDAVDALADGLDQRMTPSGAPFSEREQRRLALVRGLAQRPRALLLDRALDGLGLDESRLAELIDGVFRADAPWTVVVVSDEPAVAARCTERVSLRDQRLDCTL
jgi:ABC-type bacteriocin/lantibiotic exporter with double-glycine peptidase domain